MTDKATRTDKEIIERLKAAFSVPPKPGDGQDLPDAPPIPKAGQQTVAVLIQKKS